ncbi:MAG: choice-of-anchor tandem repeat GloVer-containing protein [Candidatus Korobacteraceae bacterium]
MHPKQQFRNLLHRTMSHAVRAVVTVAIGFGLVAMSAARASGQTYHVLYSFTGGADGSGPFGGVTMDAAGNLYGTTYSNGVHGFGTVFKLSHKNGSWLFAPLYSFQNVPDGAHPAARVIFGPNGTLYGTTQLGGTGCRGIGCGTIFNLRPPATICRSVLCPWSETVLHWFGDVPDGSSPYSEVVFDRTGNFYGTTIGGGINGRGAVYEMNSLGGESVIYSFQQGDDGASPQAGLIFDASGNLYGASSAGGTNYGAVIELTPTQFGWNEQTLHTFQDYNLGASPIGGLAFDSSGNLYGTTIYGGAQFSGTVYQLTPSLGSWTFHLLYSLAGNDGEGPLASLILDSAGNLYGTTYVDGAHQQGAVFKLTHSGSGWTYTSLHDFTGGSDGAGPLGQLIFDANGNLYGTTGLGGIPGSCDSSGCGVIFEITP